MSTDKSLIADDDARISALMGGFLMGGGYEMCAGNRSFAALATAREFRPNAVSLNAGMPGKDGGAVDDFVGSASV